MESIRNIRDKINEIIGNLDEKYFSGYSATKLIIATALITCITKDMITSIQETDDIGQSFKQLALDLLKKLPGVGEAVEQEKLKLVEKVVRGYAAVKNEKAEYKLPEKGYDPADIIRRVKNMIEDEEENFDAENRSVSGTVYIGGENAKTHTDMQAKVYEMTALSNPLHPETFPSQRKFESEVVSMTLNMMNAPEGACGNLTTGGTESILMAMKAYRDQKPWIKKPEIVIPFTAHAAFDKAAHYFKMKLIKVPVNEETQEVEASTMRKYITKNTVVIVGSAPCYSAGVVDPIEDLGKLAEKYNVGLHVDACLGGFFVPFAKKLQPNRVPNFDFGVPQVTSMSADTHKYGMAVKGSSVVMYRTPELRRNMYFLHSQFAGGFYASPTMPGSRAGGLVAACWASLLHIGEEGYLNNAQEILDSIDIIHEGVKQNENISIMGTSKLMVLALKSINPKLNIYHVVDAMSKYGWKLNPLQSPAGAHFCMTAKTMGVERAKHFVDSLNKSVETCLKSPEIYKDGTAPVYGAAISIPVKEIEWVTERILDSWTNVNYSNGIFKD
mmetsp:Transcript_2842/g.4092  ORF Transcript_2842/g.4092 Transcript_2842/m.4092 type:complete len:556 (-) Transcript_2842:761-2428(-)